MAPQVRSISIIRLAKLKKLIQNKTRDGRDRTKRF